MISLFEGHGWAGTYHHSIWEAFFHTQSTPKTGVGCGGVLLAGTGLAQGLKSFPSVTICILSVLDICCFFTLAELAQLPLQLLSVALHCYQQWCLQRTGGSTEP